MEADGPPFNDDLYWIDEIIDVPHVEGPPPTTTLFDLAPGVLLEWDWDYVTPPCPLDAPKGEELRERHLKGESAEALAAEVGARLVRRD